MLKLAKATAAQTAAHHGHPSRAPGIAGAGATVVPVHNTQHTGTVRRIRLVQLHCRLAGGRLSTHCISRESSPGHIDGDDVFCH